MRQVGLSELSNKCVVCERPMDELVPGTDKTHISFQDLFYNHPHWRHTAQDEATIYDLGYRSDIVGDEILDRYAHLRNNPVFIMGQQDAQGDRELAILGNDD